MPLTPLIVVADANILINFMNIGRLDLLKKCSHEFVITDHVREDRWNLRLGQDLPAFMEQGLSESNRVVCVCSEHYIDKAKSSCRATEFKWILCGYKNIGNYG